VRRVMRSIFVRRAVSMAFAIHVVAGTASRVKTVVFVAAKGCVALDQAWRLQRRNRERVSVDSQSWPMVCD